MGPTATGRLGRGLRKAGLVCLALLTLAAMLVGWQQVRHRRQPAAAQRLAGVGSRAYGARCAACHGEHLEGRHLAQGLDVPPLDKPGFRLFFALLPDAMESWVRDQIQQGNAVMPAFGREVDSDTLDALAYYVRAVNTGLLGPALAVPPAHAP